MIGLLVSNGLPILSRGDLIPAGDGDVAVIWPIGSQTVLSVQPDGSFQTRPKTAIGEYEIARRDGNILIYHPGGNTYAVPITVLDAGPIPEPPPVPPPTWVLCGSIPGLPLVVCINDDVQPGQTPEGAFEVTKRVAWQLRGLGAGLLLKSTGENIVSWHGQSFSASRICYPDRHSVKVMGNVPAQNFPSWQVEGEVPSNQFYTPAIDPEL